MSLPRPWTRERYTPNFAGIGDSSFACVPLFDDGVPPFSTSALPLKASTRSDTAISTSPDAASRDDCCFVGVLTDEGYAFFAQEYNPTPPITVNIPRPFITVMVFSKYRMDKIMSKLRLSVLATLCETGDMRRIVSNAVTLCK